jgi:hypothetical protein
VVVDGVEVARDGRGVVAIPLGRERQAIRVEEPRKPAIVEEVRVLVDAPGDVEDKVVYSTSANTTIVHTGERDALTRAPEPQTVLPDPLSLLVDAEGPFFGPADGEGVILIVSDATALATVGTRKVELEASRSRFKAQVIELGGAQLPVPAGARDAAPSLPAVVRLEPASYPLRIERRGFQPFATTVTIRPREYTLVAVRLAEERSE